MRKLGQFFGYDARLDVFANGPDLLNTLEQIFGKPPAFYRDQAMMSPPDWPGETVASRLCVFQPPEGILYRKHMDFFGEGDSRKQMYARHIWKPEGGTGRAFQAKGLAYLRHACCREPGRSVALEPGSILLWHGLLHHGIPANKSGRSRRSLQVHFYSRRG